MHTATIGEFPIYVFTPDEEVPDTIDPMSYQILIKTSAGKYTHRAFCQNIPCDFCLLINHGCSPGKEQTSIVNYVRKEMPELYL